MKLAQFIIPVIAFIMQPIIVPAQSIDDQSVKTLPTGTITRIAFGSCAFQSVPQPIFRTVANRKPDLYLSLGDAIYADYDLKKKIPYDVTRQTLLREWKILADSPDWQYLSSRVAVMATWDNHDYGHYQAGEAFSLKKESKKIFLDFFSEPDNSIRRQSDGIYDAKIFGPDNKRVQIILLDTRSFKMLPKLAQRPEGSGGSLGKFTPNSDPDARLLGDAQWKWLEKELKKPVQLRIIASSTQIIADQKHMDEWGNFPLERKKLFDLINNSFNSPTLLLSGNVHFSEISELKTKDYNLIDFTSSGLTHTNDTYAQATNKYRIKGPFSDLNFGFIEIDWEDDNGPSITLQAIGLDGTVAYSLKKNFNALSMVK